MRNSDDSAAYYWPYIKHWNPSQALIFAKVSQMSGMMFSVVVLLFLNLLLFQSPGRYAVLISLNFRTILMTSTTLHAKRIPYRSVYWNGFVICNDMVFFFYTKFIRLRITSSLVRPLLAEAFFSSSNFENKSFVFLFKLFFNIFFLC